MKRYWIWFRLEWKRAVCRLPVLMIEAVILAAAAGVIAFCGLKAAQGEKVEKAVFAIAAPQDELTLLAVAFVESMDAMQSLGTLQHVGREEGIAMLQRGEAMAMIELPERVMEGILDGSNVPAVLYLPDAMPVSAMLLQELAGAGVAMLGTAQAEIYAAHEMLRAYGAEEQSRNVYRDINRYNLGLVLNREQLFRMKQVSPVGTQSAAVYYVSAGAAMLTLLLGLALGDYPLSGRKNRQMLVRAGMSSIMQTVGEWAVMTLFLLAGSVLTVLCLAAGAGLLGVPKIADVLGQMGIPSMAAGLAAGRSMLSAVQGRHVVGILCVYMCSASLLQLLYRCIRNKEIILAAVGILSMGMGLASGCFIPFALLPRGVQVLAGWLPLTYMRQIWNKVLAGQVNGLHGDMGILVIFTLICIAGSLCVRHREA